MTRESSSNTFGSHTSNTSINSLSIKCNIAEKDGESWRLNLLLNISLEDLKKRIK